MLIIPKNILSARSLVEICSASPKSDDKKAEGPLALIIGLSSIVREILLFKIVPDNKLFTKDFWIRGAEIKRRFETRARIKRAK